MHMTVREWISNYNRGDYLSPDYKTQCEAGWYDWFCVDEQLSKRLSKMAKIIVQINNNFILDNYRVWFKNNSPLVGPLYDDMRFEPLDDGQREKLYFGIALDDKRRNSKYVVFTAKNDYQDTCYFTRSPEVVKFLNEWKG